jgi:hypothetical protein
MLTGYVPDGEKSDSKKKVMKLKKDADIMIMVTTPR